MEEQTVEWGTAFFVLGFGCVIALVVHFFAGKILVQLVEPDEKSTAHVVAMKSPPYIALLILLATIDSFVKIAFVSYENTVLANLIIFALAILIILRMVKSIRQGITEARYGDKSDKKRYK